MPIISTKRHQLKFEAAADEADRLQDIKYLLETLRAVKINPRVQKMMLDRTVWLVVELTGNFYSRYRSHGTLSQPYQKIQRDHIYTRKALVAELQSENADLQSVIERAQCCIVTKEEHGALTRVPKDVQGWDRYRQASPPVRVRNMETGDEIV